MMKTLPINTNFVDLTIIADYGGLHDLAFAEVKQRLHTKLRRVTHNIDTVSVTPFNTVETGFVFAQLALNAVYEDRVAKVFYINTAPRADSTLPRVDNAGEGFICGVLSNGVVFFAVNSGYSLSFVRKHIKELYKCPVSDRGSQFRSRDVFPHALDVLFSHEGMGEFIPLDPLTTIPVMEEDTVCYIDGYGNLKTNIDAAMLKNSMGGDLHIEAPHCPNMLRSGHTCKIVDGIFGVGECMTAASVGSSGWNIDGDEKRFVEIAVRGGNAREEVLIPAYGEYESVVGCRLIYTIEPKKH